MAWPNTKVAVVVDIDKLRDDWCGGSWWIVASASWLPVRAGYACT